jgi:hypothetical protein
MFSIDLMACSWLEDLPELPILHSRKGQLSSKKKNKPDLNRN